MLFACQCHGDKPRRIGLVENSCCQIRTFKWGVDGCSLTRSLGGQVGSGGEGDGMNDGLEDES
ncbi:hypothetical protein C1X93_28975 [Pseudomonas sp. GW456-11-11-14-LB1]|nr:hypothetical protein C1Y06_28165 [Pseudomonas sp. FW306-02-H06C]PMZ49545.1 hypothetical protein C1Y04_28680 [Pseudomonas sp. FW306-2-11AC]PMZ79124.1 hypothetical protein C1X94_28640 [Pseudomonas sp. FW306-02-H05-AB]PNA09303.1 hypothetical protein C1X93_28975 [Pseudomonas sp. GW456-11-11-14-LB1]